MIVTVFNGSPRGRNSNSHKIVKPFLEGAKEAGAEVSEIFLIDRKIEYCRGCFACWTETPGQCVIKDDMNELINLFLESDFAGLATPVYGMLMTALLKNFTDRLLPLATPHLKRNNEGDFYHEGRFKNIPRQILICNSGFPGEHNFEMLKTYFSQQNFVLEVYRDSGEILQETLAEDSQVSDNIRKFYTALKTAGKELVSTGSINHETLEKLHIKLIDEEEYAKGANEYWDQQLSDNQNR